MSVQEDSLGRDRRISVLGEILNSHRAFFREITVRNSEVDTMYRFAPPTKTNIQVRDLINSRKHDYPLWKRVKAACLLGRVYRNARDESEKQRAEEELNQCRLGKFFKYVYRKF